MEPIKYREFDNKSSLEFAFLRLFDIADSPAEYSKLIKPYSTFSDSWREPIGMVVKIIEGLTIISTYSSYIVIEEPADLKEGDILLIVNNSEGIHLYDRLMLYVQIKPDVIDVANQCQELPHATVRAEFQTGDTITKQSYLVAYQKAVKEHNLAIAEEETKRAAGERKAIQSREDYKLHSIFRDEYRSSTIDGDTLKASSYTIRINCQFNTIYDFDNVYHVLQWDKGRAVQEFINRGVTELWLGSDAHIKVEPRNSTINDIPVKKDRIATIIRHTNTFAKEEIETINKLGVQRLAFLDVKNVSVKGIRIPVSTVPVTTERFKLDLGELSTEIEWAELTALFGHIGINLTNYEPYIEPEKFLALMQRHFDKDKVQSFEFLRQYKMLGEL